MHMITKSLLAAALVMPGAVVWAAETGPFNGTVVNLESQAHKTVQQDRLTVTLAFSKTEPTAIAAQAAVNTAMQLAKKAYDTAEGVKVTTGNYTVWKQEPYEPGPKPLSPAEREKRTMWQARQELTLDSSKQDVLLKVMGTLQSQGFTSENMTYYLSREARDAVKDDLTVQALKSIRQQAKAVAGALDMKEAGFGAVSINADGGYEPRPVMMMAKAAPMAERADAVPAPVAQGGETDVTVRVNAEVRLK